MDIRKRIRIIFFCESASLFQENAFYPLTEMSSQRAQNAGKGDVSVNILLYEGSLRNRVPLCGELGLARSNDARETELAILSAGYRRWGKNSLAICTDPLPLSFWTKMDSSFAPAMPSV